MSSHQNHCLAITDKGELYGWGQNLLRQQGFEGEGDKEFPQKVPFFENYNVLKVSAGHSHSLVVAHKKDDATQKKIVFAIGREENQYGMFGYNEEQYKENQDFVHHLKQFDHLDPVIICAGNKCSFVTFKGDKLPTDSLSIHEGYTCEVTNESPIKGTMHFW